MAEFKVSDKETKQRNRDEEMSGMVFKWKKIEFYPEDLAKAETMEHEEKMEFFMRLRQENRYIEVDDDAPTDK